MARGPLRDDGLVLKEDGVIDLDVAPKSRSGRVRRGPTGNLTDNPAEFVSPDRQTSKRPDAYTGILQDESTYLTTKQLGEELGQWPAQIHRYCKKWFGDLPPTRTTKGQGYRIPLNYRYVARGWLQTEDPEMREAMRAALAEDPKDFVVVVAGRASTHYTVHEAMERIGQVLESAARRSKPVTVMYVGPNNRSKRNHG